MREARPHGPAPQEVSDNAGVLRYLGQGSDPADVEVDLPTDETDRWRLGAHPDIVERLWDELAVALPPGSARLVAGGAALMDPRSGRIVAVALGTTYAIRLTGRALEAARARDYATLHAYETVGRTLDLTAAFGSGWVFGQHGPDEAAWLAASLEEA